MRRLGLSVLTLIALLAIAAGLYLVPAVQDALFIRAIGNNAELRDDLLGTDAMRVLVCGSSGPLPHPNRAGTCLAVFAGGRMYVVDAGQGAWNNLALWRVPGEAIDALFITHLHSDHIGELGEINLNTWIAGRKTMLRVYGPDGVQEVVNGFNVAYRLDHSYRTAHHGPAIANPATGNMTALPIPLRTKEIPEAMVYDEHSVRVMAFIVDHAPAKPALGYRFEYGGRTVVISGDTRPTQELKDMAKGADLLVHEALAPQMLPAMADAARAAHRAGAAKILTDIPEYHTTPVQAAQIANSAKVRALLLYHLVPAPRNDLMKRIFMRGVSDVRAGVVAADDGTLVTLPVKSQVVEFSHI